MKLIYLTPIVVLFFSALAHAQTSSSTGTAVVKAAQADFNKCKSMLETDGNVVSMEKAHSGDFTGDGKEDVVIYYALASSGGGNAGVGQGLVLYENVGNNVEFITRYSPDYLFSFKKIADGHIFINKDEYTDDDPRCCPSIHKEMELSVDKGKVFERSTGKVN